MAVKSLPPEFPIFVKTDEDKTRWKASEDFVRSVFGLKSTDVDMLGYLARAVYDNPEEIPTEGLLGVAPSKTAQQVADAVPGRFDNSPEADPMMMRDAIRDSQNVIWIDRGDGSFDALINGVPVTTDFVLSQQSVARLCYLLSPLTSAMGDIVVLRLTKDAAPGDDPENPAMVSSKDGSVTFWKADELVAGGTKIDEAVFDYTVALAMQAWFKEDKYREAGIADQQASQEFALKYQKKFSRSLSGDVGPIVVIGAPFLTIYGKDQPVLADFTDSIAVWFQAQRHGRLNGFSGLAKNVKFSDVFPNRDRYFRSW